MRRAAGVNFCLLYLLYSRVLYYGTSGVGKEFIVDVELLIDRALSPPTYLLQQWLPLPLLRAVKYSAIPTIGTHETFT